MGWRRYWKAILAAAGGATGGGVVAALRVFGVDIDPDLGWAIAIILSTGAVRFGPANQPASRP